MPDTRHGHFHWNELMTWDAGKAKDFYAQTLGWTYEQFAMEGGGDYTVCKAGDEIVGGIFAMQKGQGMDQVPDHWFAYITVDDVDARLEEVTAAGGAIQRPAFDVPEVGRIAIVQDKAGAHIGWITPAAQG